MTVEVQLLGRPTVARDGAAVAPPRGHKGWALLAYLLLADRPPGREHLAELLFAEADDPMGALRWSLSELRRVLGRGATLEGDPVLLTVRPDTIVDVLILARGTWSEAVALSGLGRSLLEGVTPAASPAFELWLASERRRLLGASESVLHSAAHTSLARGDLEAALGHASRLVQLNPLDENYHILLVRCLRLVGRMDEAADHCDRAARLLRDEFGVEPSPALRSAMAQNAPAVTVGAASIEAKLDRGEAAVAAGALEEGLQVLRSAVAAARAEGAELLLARSLLALGDALVHAARGGDEEGAAALNEAAVLAEQLGEHALGARARRELAMVEFYRARYEHQLALLDEAADLAGDDVAERAWIDLLRGGALTDLGHYEEAEHLLSSATEAATLAEAPDAAAFAWSLLARLHLLRGELHLARAAAERSIDSTRVAGWTAFRPWPEALLAEVELLEGDLASAGERFQRAFALGRELDDPCWEAIGARGMGLVAHARGETGRALEMLADAPRMCRRLPDSSKWIEAYALEAACRLAVEVGSPSAPAWVSDLEAIAARSAMRELLVRSLLHRAALGDAGALEAALLHAEGVDNPVLHDVCRSAQTSHVASHARA